MENIKSYLENMETVTLTGDRFIHFKCRIQDELYKMSENPPNGFEDRIKEILTTWRLLGGTAGTLQGYVSAMTDLRTFISDVEATQLPVF